MVRSTNGAEGSGGYVAVAFTCDMCLRQCTRFTHGDPRLIRRCFSVACENAGTRRDSDSILSLVFGPASERAVEHADAIVGETPRRLA